MMYKYYLEPISEREDCKKKYWEIRDALIFYAFFYFSFVCCNCFERGLSRTTLWTKTINSASEAEAVRD